MATNAYYRVALTGVGAVEDLSPYVSTVEVDEDEARPSRCTVELVDPHAVLAQALREGITLEVDAGEPTAHSLIFRGRVHEMAQTFEPGARPTLTLAADDSRMRMGLCPRSRRWVDTTLGGLVGAVCGPYRLGRLHDDLAADVVIGRPGIRQHEETDLAFLTRVARRYACVLVLDSGECEDRLGLVAESRLGAAGTALALSLGSGMGRPMHAFQARHRLADVRLPLDLASMDGDSAVTSRHQQQATVTTASDRAGHGGAIPGTVSGVTDDRLVTAHRDAPAQAALVDRLLAPAQAAATSIGGELGTDDSACPSPFASVEELRGVVRNRSERFRGGMTASGTTDGTPRLRPLVTVAVDGTGARFLGVWLVSRVRHIVDGKGYRTEFDLRR